MFRGSKVLGSEVQGSEVDWLIKFSFDRIFGIYWIFFNSAFPDESLKI
jgi:hypothetical protein